VGPDGEVRLYEPLAKHTTLRVGGPAQFWVEPRNEQVFAEIIRLCRQENLPLFVIGRGSNLLVRDGGIRGVVVHPSGGDFDRIEVSGNEITAGVGAKLKEVAYAGKRAGIGGFEWMEGIPGAVGGGLRMNAGAMGSETFQNVVSVRYLDGEGNPHVKRADELEVHYRHVPSLQKNYAVSAIFRGAPAPVDEIKARMDESQNKRRTSQPAASSAGCIFKNPPGNSAGRLIDESGLKGARVGDAEVSTVHANFIVNRGHATSSDIIGLVRKIRAQVKDARGVDLEPEVLLYGQEWRDVL
jgi:UDP-N-acetylenolpyruvoylglucosamine reductase